MLDSFNSNGFTLGQDDSSGDVNTNNNNITYCCRACLSKKIEEFKINHYGFPGKNENWKSFFCFDLNNID